MKIPSFNALAMKLVLFRGTESCKPSSCSPKGGEVKKRKKNFLLQLCNHSLLRINHTDETLTVNKSKKLSQLQIELLFFEHCCLIQTYKCFVLTLLSFFYIIDGTHLADKFETVAFLSKNLLLTSKVKHTIYEVAKNLKPSRGPCSSPTSFLSFYRNAHGRALKLCDLFEVSF